MKKLLLLAGFTVSAAAVTAQTLSSQVISSTGGLQVNAAYSISYTVAQPVAGPVANGGILITQGFQQAYKTMPSVSGRERLGIYPNPAIDVIFISAGFEGEGHGRIRVFDLMGREVLVTLFTKGSEPHSEMITVHDMASGLYLIKSEFNPADGIAISTTEKVNIIH